MKFKIYFLFVSIFLSSCVNKISIGIPYIYNGHYRSRNYILDGGNFLFIRVFEGGLTIYFADESVSNITELGYTSISGYDITGYSDTMYVFETGSISGVVVLTAINILQLNFQNFWVLLF